ncbi:hypothetical protein RI543_004341 [Arxiozyma heterogenica]|uniref:Uncharacterized protein n=1 Tax=Arxiozyma heterogenica TaxID=278026 RepID=A0AAN7WFV5_9SACH|nr:hypothetical protein RI543_004341 [Kazachstania heterogenica]
MIVCIDNYGWYSPPKDRFFPNKFFSNWFPTLIQQLSIHLESGSKISNFTGLKRVYA